MRSSNRTLALAGAVSSALIAVRSQPAATTAATDSAPIEPPAARPAPAAATGSTAPPVPPRWPPSPVVRSGAIPTRAISRPTASWPAATPARRRRSRSPRSRRPRKDRGRLELQARVQLAARSAIALGEFAKENLEIEFQNAHLRQLHPSWQHGARSTSPSAASRPPCSAPAQGHAVKVHRRQLLPAEGQQLHRAPDGSVVPP